eukprot:TRINITY_DN1419_c0_g1_i1.p1 TRINITY_DN1419_c0_g1~~TRINITY_DN1419_c0_g1_i1.p1  ORF type:complete len:296 (-),score=15.18 TRINITY_DN1419_c0_g1_i1:227-1114(-)
MANASLSSFLYAALISLTYASTATAGDYYRLLRQDFRRCAAPLCGGYFVEKLNKRNSTFYVGAIDYAKANKGVEETVATFTSTIQREGSFPSLVADGLIIFYADLIPYPRRVRRGLGKVSYLGVITAYLGLPGQKIPESGFTYYTVVTKQETTSVRKLNSDILVTVERSSVSPVKPVGFLDLAWQLNQILNNKAIVLGRVVKRGPRAVFSSKAVFIKLPLVKPECPLYKIRCDTESGGYVIFTRTPDLCLKPVCLTKPRVCPRIRLICPLGYRLYGSCTPYYCDPIFAPLTDSRT